MKSLNSLTEYRSADTGPMSLLMVIISSILLWIFGRVTGYSPFSLGDPAPGYQPTDMTASIALGLFLWFRFFFQCGLFVLALAIIFKFVDCTLLRWIKEVNRIE
jgi:hypothetical protein